jgi:hypothetical protein
MLANTTRSSIAESETRQWTIRFWAVDVNLPTNTYRYWSAERAATI